MIRGNPRVVWAIVWASGASTVAAQSRETLETKVTGVRSSIVLEWSKNHPWDAQLAAAPPYLIAEYRTAGAEGRLAVDCFIDPNDVRTQRPGGVPCLGIQGEGTPGTRTWRFRLPEQTSRAPSGPVCLAIRLPNQRVLPIRRTDQSRGETSRFRYEGWETAAVARAAARTKDARAKSLRDSVDYLARRLREVEATNQANGWTSEAACQGVAAPDFLETGGVRRPVAPDSLSDRLARLVCLLKVKNAPNVKPEYQYAVVQPPATLDRLLGLLPAPLRTRFLETRASQAEQYRRDWSEQGPLVEPYRQALLANNFTAPHFGRFDDFVLLQSLAADSAEADIFRPIARGEAPDPQRLAGYIGANLEAFGVCRSDGLNQMATAREAAIGFRSRTVALRERARQQVVEACQAGIGTLARLAEEHRTLAARLATLEGASTTGTEISSLPERSQQLNSIACTP